MTRKALSWTLQLVLDRSIEVGDCWEWQLATIRNAYPKITIARGQYYVRYIVFVATKGRQPARGKLLSTSCRNPLCVNPAHVIETTKSATLKRAYEGGAFRGVMFRAAVARGQAKNCKLTDAGVQEIRSTSEPMADVAARLGISERHAIAVRNHRARIDYSNPFAGLYHFGQRP